MTQTSMPRARSAPCLGASVTAALVLTGSTGPAGKCQLAVCAVTQQDHTRGPRWAGLAGRKWPCYHEAAHVRNGSLF